MGGVVVRVVGNIICVIFNNMDLYLIIVMLHDIDNKHTEEEVRCVLIEILIVYYYSC